MSVEWIWWIAAAVLIGAELLTVSFYLLAVGLALALGRVAAWPGASVQLQFAVAGVLGVGLSSICSVTYQPSYVRLPLSRESGKQVKRAEE